MVRVGSGIDADRPEDLSGKRVGVVDYQMTTAVWTRGIFHYEFGVPPEEIEWFQGRPDPVIPGARAFVPPDGVTIHPPPNDLNAMMVDGDLDALVSVYPPRKGPLADRERFRPLFADGMAEATRYFKTTGVFPAHHATIVRESILREHPWVAQSLLDAFTEAQLLAFDRTYVHPPSALIFARQMLAAQHQIFGDNPYAYGVSSNATTVGMIQHFAHRHGLIGAPLSNEALYAPGVLES